MSLFDEIIAVYPDLTVENFHPKGVIGLRNDSDGAVDYIAKWEYSEPIPK